MAKNTNTDIKFSTIKQKAKQTHNKEKYELEDGSTITFYPIFPPTLIEEMFKEIQTIFQTKDEKLVNLSEDMMMKYVLFMCIKHFTHLKSQLKATTFIGQIDEMTSIIDTIVENGRIDLFSLIIDEIFIQKEIQNIFDKLSKFSANFLFLAEMDQKMQREFQNLKLKNADLLKEMENITDENKVVQ
jgi:hypothetical protein